MNLKCLITWSEKYQDEIEGTEGHEMSQTSNIQLNISLKPKTQIEFREKPIQITEIPFKQGMVGPLI